MFLTIKYINLIVPRLLLFSFKYRNKTKRIKTRRLSCLSLFLKFHFKSQTYYITNVINDKVLKRQPSLVTLVNSPYSRTEQILVTDVKVFWIIPHFTYVIKGIWLYYKWLASSFSFENLEKLKDSLTYRY